MRKITDFIIDKRYFILFLFIILTILCSFLSSKVIINHDIAKYLPNTSETRIGMNIMEKEFSEVKTSTLNVMFKGITDEKENIKKYLESIEGVKSVDYDNTEKFNKKDYSLYIVTVNDAADSKLATKVYKKILNNYKDYTIFTSGDVSETNKSVLPLWIIGLAVLCALIILLIMCESYVEPFLFLITILMAIVLNSGTNIIFKNVSHITNSIAAILQMALSMDYSIMLMHRYDQEKQVEKDKIKAMKNALHKAFQSISSSSITTIVGLLALVFMSFTIGRDLGFVLAKGVLFSLICIFFILPSLILLFDKWIVKTKKRSPQIKLDKLGKYSYTIRFISVPLFILVFITSFLLKGSLGIDYTDKQSDEISKIFKENNQIAIIYKNKDEEKIKKLLKIFNNNKIKKTLAYSNTINEKLPYNKLNNKLTELGSNVKIDDYLLRIIYYNYYSPNNNRMTFNQFVTFIENEAYKNNKINSKLNTNIKNNITKLKNFTTNDLINKKRSLDDISNILDIDKSKVDDILVYYLSKNNNVKISLNDFVTFINKDVLSNEKYSTRIDEESKNKLSVLEKLIDERNISKKMSSSEMAQFFGIDNNTVNELYKYYVIINDSNIKLTISEFSNFVLNNSNFTNGIDQETVQNLKIMATFSDLNIITKQMNSKELSNLFGIEESKVKEILLLKYLNKESDSKYTISEFIDNVKFIKTYTHYLDNFDISNLERLENTDLYNSSIKYNSIELSSLLSININDINKLYTLIDFSTGNISRWIATPSEFVQIILANSSNQNIKDAINESMVKKLNLLSNIMTSSINNNSFTYQELSQLINLDSNIIKNIYGLYNANKKIIYLTPQEFINFILLHKNDSVLSNNINNSTINNLKFVNSIIDSVLTNKKYSSDELASLLGINKNNINLLFGLYNFKNNENVTISLRQIVDFLLSDVIINPEYSNNFTSKQISKLNVINGVINSSLNNVKYTADEIFAIISNLADDIDKNYVEVLYIYYGSYNEYNNRWKITVEEFVYFLNNNILKDKRFKDFIDKDMREKIINAKLTVSDAKKMLVGDKYSRIVLNTNFDFESPTTFNFIKTIQNKLNKYLDDCYVIGDSPMALEMSKSFNNELNLITIITMISIFIVVAITFKSIIIPTILVLTIQCAVYLTMGILSFAGENVYFIALLIVQSVLMGATIDYAILYTSYYLENRKINNIKEAIKESYNKSIHTILTSSSILIIVTLIIANFASAIAAKICRTISEGTLCSTILILLLLPSVLACCDKLIFKNKKNKK